MATREELIGRAMLAQQEVANQKALQEEQRYRDATTLLWREAVATFGEEHLATFGFSVVRYFGQPSLQAVIKSGITAFLDGEASNWMLRFQGRQGIHLGDDIFDHMEYPDRLALAVHIAESNEE